MRVNIGLVDPAGLVERSASETDAADSGAATASRTSPKSMVAFGDVIMRLFVLVFGQSR